MADDVKVTIGAESGGFSSEVQKVGKQIENLRNSGKKAAGMFEGDRRVENKLTAWAQGFTNARNAADVLANTLGNLGDIFKTSLVIGAGLNVGAAIIKGISDAIENLKKFKAELAAVEASIFSAGDALNEGGLIKGIAEATDKVKEMKAGWLNWSKEIAQTEGAIQSAIGSLYDLAQVNLAIANAEAIGDKATADRIRERLTLLAMEQKLKEGKLPASEVEQLLAAESERLRVLREAAEAKKREAVISAEAAERTKAEAEQAAAEAKRTADETKRAADDATRYANELANATASLAEANNQVEQFLETDEEKLARLEKEVQWHKALAEGAENELIAAKERATAARKTLEVLSLMNGINDKNVKAANDEADASERKLRAEQEVADAKANLAKAQSQLPGAEGAVRRAEELVDQVQGQRQAASAIGLFKSGASMGLQRAWQRFYQRQAENNAGVVARDEFRRKVGGDADKMEALKGLIEERKQQILGQAGKNNPEAKLEKAKADLSAIKTAVENAVRILGKK